MGFLKKLTGILGFGHNDTGHGHSHGHGHGAVRDDEDGDGDNNTGKVSGDGDKRREDNNQNQQQRFRETGLPRKGFGVPVQVAVERSNPGPILQPCAARDGGVQGLHWYSMRLKIDEDGDVADEFLEDQTLPRRCKTKAAKVRGLVICPDGKLQPLMH
ncbi:unnamed protein product [Cochlearia groenlandica]